MLVLQRGFWMLSQFWLFTLPGILVFLFAVFSRNAFATAISARQRRSMLLLLVFPLLILTWSSLFWYSDRQSLAPEWPANVLGGLMLAHVLAVILLLQSSQATRVRSAIAGVSSLWVSFWLFFIGVMAVSNDWL